MRSSRDQLLTLQVAHRRRLDQLLIKQAALGAETPPNITTEIEDIQQELIKLQASIDAVETVTTLAEESQVGLKDRRDIEPRLHVMVATIQATVAEFSNLRVFVSNEFARVYRILKYIGFGMIALEVLRFVMQLFGF